MQSTLPGTASLLIYLAVLLIYIIRRQRNFFDIPDAGFLHFSDVGVVLGLGYLFHYLPYFLVDRTLFLHHYIPG